MIILRFITILMVCCLVLAAAPPTADEQTLRLPSMPEWKLLHKVDPAYPAAARRHRIQGTVRFNVVIGKDGRIERLRLVSGHPLLVRAAREAARQWVYRPTLLGDEPVRVITQIEVQFRLDRPGKPLDEDRKFGTGSIVPSVASRQCCLSQFPANFPLAQAQDSVLRCDGSP